jgi:transcriptional regulator with XRE-family HTH domain
VQANICKEKKYMEQNLHSNKDLMRKIQYIRKKNNLSGAEMANKLGISAPYYSQIENGKRGISKELLANICDQFPEVAYEWLVEDKGEPPYGEMGIVTCVQYSSDNVNLKTDEYIGLREELAGWKREAQIYKEVNDKILERIERAFNNIEKRDEILGRIGTTLENVDSKLGGMENKSHSKKKESCISK